MGAGDRRATFSAPALAAWLLAVLPADAAQGAEASVLDVPGADETITVRGETGDRIAIVPSEPVDAVFGLDKTLFETPRSAISIAVETMDRFGMTDIDDLVMLSASSFTQSFFGVSGSLDLRGTSGENYFNGIRRLDNPGNYATPIGAADRVATAEVGGPVSLGGRQFGYYLFGEWEDSGSYYRDTGTDNVILQATFNVDLSDRLRVLWGGMYQDYEGNEVGGWNRLTQDLIDHGTYVTGLAKPLDADGDGSISHAEYDAANGGAGLFEFVVDPASRTGPSVFGGDFALDPDTIGTAKLDGDQVLVARDDVLRTEDLVFYADLHFTSGPRWQVTNKLYFEGYDHLSEVAYGFAEFADSRVFEDQLIVTFSEAMGWGRLRLLVSSSIRRTDFEHANDFVNEHFDRRDLTGPSTARDRRLLATRIDRDYTDYSEGSYTTFALAVLTDLDWDNGLNAVLGIRQEGIDVESHQRGRRRRSGESFDAEDTVDVLSYTASLSYRTSVGLMPYVTVSEQTTVVVGQGAEILAANVAEGRAVATSELFELGVKGAFLDGRLFAQAVYFEQERTDLHAQAIVTNQASRSEGYELEMRWQATERMSVIAAYTNLEVVNLNTLENGGRFSFLGAGDLPGTDPATFYGGTVGGFVTLASNPDAVRAGVPKHLAAVTALYEWEDWRVFASAADVASVYSGFSRRVKLPAYTLVNAGLQYDGRRWSITVSGKNLTDERYFRANFPNLFGGVIVLPELPRHFQAIGSPVGHQHEEGLFLARNDGHEVVGVLGGGLDDPAPSPLRHGAPGGPQTFADGEVLRIARVLVRATGKLTVLTEPAGVWIERDGTRLAEGTPVTLDGLPAGLAELTLGTHEHETIRVEVDIPKDGVGTLERTLRRIPHGTLTLELDPPDATVTLPDIEPAYRAGMRLPPGEYAVRVSAEGYVTREDSVRHRGEVTLVAVALESAGPQPGETFSDALASGGAGPEMVVIPAGSFRMGCVTGRDCDNDEHPVHEVRIAEPLALSAYEVTFADWEACANAGGCNGYRPDDRAWGRQSSGDQRELGGCPVVRNVAVAGDRSGVQIAERVGVGVCGPGGINDEVQLGRRDRSAPGELCRLREPMGPQPDGAGGFVCGESVGSARHAWERVGVGGRLLERLVLGRARRRQRMASRGLREARVARRLLELHPEVPPRRVPVQVLPRAPVLLPRIPRGPDAHPLNRCVLTSYRGVPRGGWPPLGPSGVPGDARWDTHPNSARWRPWEWVSHLPLGKAAASGEGS